MNDPSPEEVAGKVVDAFNSTNLEGQQGIDPSWRFLTLAGAVAAALGIPVAAACLLIASMS